LLSVILLVVVSLRTDPPDPEVADRYTWTTEVCKQESRDLEGKPFSRNDRVLSVALLAATAAFVAPFI
jgi:hypothetical protein